jgi:hypothetical protein
LTSEVLPQAKQYGLLIGADQFALHAKCGGLQRNKIYVLERGAVGRLAKHKSRPYSGRVPRWKHIRRFDARCSLITLPAGAKAHSFSTADVAEAMP